jgi:hypothetical protein
MHHSGRLTRWLCHQKLGLRHLRLRAGVHWRLVRRSAPLTRPDVGVTFNLRAKYQNDINATHAARESMTRWVRYALCCAGVTAIAGALAIGATAATATASTTTSSTTTSSRTLAPNTRFFVPLPTSAALQQEASLLRAGALASAAGLARMLATPQAVWFTGGTPAQVERQVRMTMTEAALEGAVPVLVAYDIPGRDCAQYSAGGALTDADYQAWVAAGLTTLTPTRAGSPISPTESATLRPIRTRLSTSTAPIAPGSKSAISPSDS